MKRRHDVRRHVVRYSEDRCAGASQQRDRRRIVAIGSARSAVRRVRPQCRGVSAPRPPRNRYARRAPLRPRLASVSTSTAARLRSSRPRSASSQPYASRVATPNGNDTSVTGRGQDGQRQQSFTSTPTEREWRVGSSETERRRRAASRATVARARRSGTARWRSGIAARRRRRRFRHRARRRRECAS